MKLPGPVFLDTAGLLALTNSDDSLHGAALDIQSRLAFERARLFTTDWVLTEFLGRAARRPLRAAAVEATASLAASAATRIIPATRDGWRRAFDLYRRRPDKEWSLVDCSSMLVCQSRGIRRIFTHDRHFGQAGFEVLLK